MQGSTDILAAVRCLQQLSGTRIPGIGIARAEGLDEQRTDALLERLTGAGLVTRVGGDYRLARPESEIRIVDVQRALQSNDALGPWGRMTIAQIREFENEVFESDVTAIAV